MLNKLSQPSLQTLLMLAVDSPEGRGSLRGTVQREGVGEGNGGLEGTREKGNGGLEGVREGARGGVVFLVFVWELCILAGSKNNELKEIT